MVFFEFLLTEHSNRSLRAKGLVLLLPKRRARAILRKFHYLSARLFIEQEHRENFMPTPVTLFTRRFGESFVDPDIRSTIPGLFSTQSNPR